jgi:hypothetical protein
VSGAAGRTGPSNHNWRGGRSVTKHGYVLVRVGKDHPLADVRGYAYEHRIVAEEAIGRRLLDGEQVHHQDENRSNNSPSNLQVVTLAEHRFRHRTGRAPQHRRLPHEVNEERECACGCGLRFPRFDASGRERRMKQGHNMKGGGRVR